MATDYVFWHHPRVSSTQDAVRDLMDGVRPVVVCADEQTAGRGRQGSEWQNAPRAMAVSVGWKTSWEPEARHLLSLVAGLAAQEMVGELGYDVSLKWPNDIMLERDRQPDKVGGLLVETSDEIVVVGLGLNLWWPGSPSAYAALSDHDPGGGLVPQLSRRFADLLLGRVERGPGDWGLDEYRAACSTIGHQVTWRPDGRGMARGIDSSGGLIVDTSAGIEVLTSGEVRHVRSTG